MNLPAEPVLAEDSDDHEDLPAAKRPKTAAVVEKALDQDMREVPPQSAPVLNMACCGFIYQILSKSVPPLVLVFDLSIRESSSIQTIWYAPGSSNCMA